MRTNTATQEAFYKITNNLAESVEDTVGFGRKKNEELGVIGTVLSSLIPDIQTST